MAARKKRNRQRRRRGRFGFLYKLLSFLIIFAAILVGCVAFFRVNQVTVTGNNRYSAEEIISASGVEMGDNLFLVKKSQTSRSIRQMLPYVETVAPVVHLPDTLELRITESSAVAVIQAEGSWWLINANGKLLERGGAELGAELPVVTGITPVLPTLGEKITVEMEEQTKLDSLRALLTALDDQGMAGELNGFVDLTANNVIYFGYGTQLTVAVPMTGDFKFRVFSLQQAKKQIEERGDTLTGTLYLTYGDGEARVLPEQWLPEDTPRRGGGQDEPAVTDEPDTADQPEQ